MTDEGDRVADILLEADFLVVGILVESRLVFAGKGFLLVVFGVFGTADERKFEITGLDQGQEEQEEQRVEGLPHSVVIIDIY